MPRTIEVTVSPKGEIHLQTKGYSGGDCLQASKFLEHALGITTADRKTGEYHMVAPLEQPIQQ